MLANQHLTLEQTKGFKGILIIPEACSKDLEININRRMQQLAGNIGTKWMHKNLHSVIQDTKSSRKKQRCHNYGILKAKHSAPPSEFFGH